MAPQVLDFLFYLGSLVYIYSSDLLFSVHPVDGSLLVWVADFLDEYQPGEFRQAQVCITGAPVHCTVLQCLGELQLSHS